MIKTAPTLAWKPVLILLSVYVVVSALGMRAHELFLDEAHHFLIARDSASFSELYHNSRYDGHPLLWHVLLFFITHFLTTDPGAMQVLQLLIATGVAAVFLRYAPFSLIVKAAVLFGYYFLFEYDLLSRNYALGFLFLCCCLLADTQRNLFGIGLLLFLLCNTHVFFGFASIGIYLFVSVGYSRQKKLLTLPFLFFTGLFLLGLVCTFIQSRVVQVDNANLTPVRPAEWLSLNNFRFAADGLVRGWLPVPHFHDEHFWNHYWLGGGHTGPLLEAVLFLFLLVFPGWLLRGKPGALLFYYGCVGLLLVFFVVTQMTAARYFGMVFVFFLVAAWLSAVETQGGGLYPADVFAGLGPVSRLCLYGILAVQVLVGWYALEQDLTRPFSQSRNAAHFLQSLPSGRERIVVDGYNCGPMICAYLEGRVFYLATGQEGSFCVWKNEYFPKPRPAIGQELAQWPMLRTLHEFVLVSNRRLEAGSDSTRFRLTPLQSFENSIIGEDYYIYRVDMF